VKRSEFLIQLYTALTIVMFSEVFIAEFPRRTRLVICMSYFLHFRTSNKFSVTIATFDTYTV